LDAPSLNNKVTLLLPEEDVLVSEAEVDILVWVGEEVAL
jgi:hypothetical protein